MLAAILALLSLQQAPSQEPPDPAGVEVFHLSGAKQVAGTVLKETDEAVFVDLGHDVLRLPRATIVRREAPGEDEGAGTEHDEGVFRTRRLPEKSVKEGAREVGPAVVKIESPIGQGSGFITSPGGCIVTNFHVVEDEVEVDVVLYLREGDSLDTRTVRDVKVVAINPAIDLALLRMEPPGDLELPFVYMGDSEEVAAGDRVYAIGAPIGLDRTVSSGIVSVPHRAYGGHTMMQMTTPINPGNSGGPLFNLRGEVVGVNSAGYMGLQGLNFAIPSKYVKDFLRHRDAFAVDTTRSENGIHYLPAPRKPRGEDGADTSQGAAGR